MDYVQPTLRSLIWLPVALLIFLLPGWLASRRFALPIHFLPAFLGSSVILFELVLVFESVGIPLHAGTVGLGLTFVALAFAWGRPIREILGASTGSWRKTFRATSKQWPWLIAPALALVSISVRSFVDPLSGYDNGTRWDYLARLFLTHQSLQGYPPVSSADFELYSWCDGIPPLVPLLNFWIYAATGSIAPALTTLRVTGEALLLGSVVYRFGQLLWGENAGWPAVAALSSSALAIWSVAMGQETGLTALSLVAMLYFLELNVRSSSKPAVVWAAVAAAFGALTREYGLSFAVLGTAMLITRRQPRSAVFLFLAISAGLAAPWYIRNWILTGNPLFPQTFGGLFPGNVVHDEVMRTVAKAWGLQWSIATATFFGTILAVLAGPLLTLAIASCVHKSRPSTAIWAGIALMIGLWIWSIPQTAGGWAYSIRVLSPALALCGVLAGGISTMTRAVRGLLATAMIVFAVDAARRSWGLPIFPFISPFSSSFADWRDLRNDGRIITANPVWSVLVGEAAGRGIVVDHTADHAIITMRGGRAIPLFSPLLRPTFAVDANFDHEIARLRASGVRFITFSQQNPLSASDAGHPFWSELYLHHLAVSQVNRLIIYDLDHLPLAP